MRDRFPRLKWNLRSGSMTLPKKDTFKDYTRYAERCLNMVAETTDQESHSLRREMAAEWLTLAKAILRPRKSWQIPPLKSRQMQMG
jgi:hypothetical protein